MNTHLELVEQDNYRMYVAIKRVRELHNSSGSEYCHECGYIYPCDTIKALDGDD